MATYVRGAGGHVAERVRPVPGSEQEKQLEALADDPASGWRRAEKPKAPEPKAPDGPPAKSALKPAWVAWAVVQGMDPEEAERASKDDLIAAYGPDAQRSSESDGDPGDGGEE